MTEATNATRYLPQAVGLYRHHDRPLPTPPPSLQSGRPTHLLNAKGAELVNQVQPRAHVAVQPDAHHRRARARVSGRCHSPSRPRRPADGSTAAAIADGTGRNGGKGAGRDDGRLGCRPDGRPSAMDRVRRHGGDAARRRWGGGGLVNPPVGPVRCGRGRDHGRCRRCRHRVATRAQAGRGVAVAGA